MKVARAAWATVVLGLTGVGGAQARAQAQPQVESPQAPAILIQPEPGRFGLDVLRQPEPAQHAPWPSGPYVVPLPLGAPVVVPRIGMPMPVAQQQGGAGPEAGPTQPVAGGAAGEAPSRLAQTLAAAEVSTRALLRDDVTAPVRRRLADDVRRQIALLPGLTAGAGPLVDDARVRLAARAAALVDAAERGDRDAVTAAANDILADLDLLRRAAGVTR
jgi:hypothetical protein